MKNNNNNNEPFQQSSLEKLVKQGLITSKTAERVKIAKSIIEQKYNHLKQKLTKEKKDWEELYNYINSVNLSDNDKEEIFAMARAKASEIYRQKRKKQSINDYESIAIIGKGAFGEVRVCRHKATNEIYAIKKMLKEDMINKNQIMHVRTERDFLSSVSDNPWITKLISTFQDEYFLYLVMEFVQGGDFYTFLSMKDLKKEQISEQEAQFYIAEMILGVDSIHKMKCIHRDIKPDNVLIAANGHLKFSDFGLSVLSEEKLYPFTAFKDVKVNDTSQNNNSSSTEEKVDTNENNNNIKNKRPNRLMAFTRVGTPFYIAPEVFGRNGYGEEVDWWSIGIVLYEMLVGYPPFLSSAKDPKQNHKETISKIVRFPQYFRFPEKVNLSANVKDLIRRFIEAPSKRLKNLDEIKAHPFFKGFDWDNILNMKPPFIPNLSSNFDCKYFKVEKESEPQIFQQQKKNNLNYIYTNYSNYEKKANIENSEYFGFTFNREILEKEEESQNEILNIIKNLIKEKENQKILNESNSSAGSQPYYSNNSSNRESNSTNAPRKTSYENNENNQKYKKLNVIPIKNLIEKRRKNEERKRNSDNLDRNIEISKENGHITNRSNDDIIKIKKEKINFKKSNSPIEKRHEFPVAGLYITKNRTKMNNKKGNNSKLKSDIIAIPKTSRTQKERSSDKKYEEKFKEGEELETCRIKENVILVRKKK